MRSFTHPLLLLVVLAGCRLLPEPVPLVVPRATAAMKGALDQGFVLLRAGRDEPAVRRAGELLAAHPWWVEAHRLHQLARLEQGRSGPLLNRYLALAREHPGRPEAWYLLGRISHPVDRQETCFRRALDLNPGFARAWGGLASVAMARGDLEKAREHLRRAMALAPAQADFPLALGRLQPGKPDLARQLLEKAARLDPADPAPLLALAGLEGGFYPSRLAAALRVAPAAKECGQAVLEAARRGRAGPLLLHALAGRPDLLSPSARLALARLRAAAGETLGPILLLERVRREEGWLPAAEARLLGRLLLRRGRDRAGLAALLGWVPAGVEPAGSRSRLQAAVAGPVPPPAELALLLRSAGFLRASRLVAARVGKKEEVKGAVPIPAEEGGEEALFMEGALADCLRTRSREEEQGLADLIAELRRWSSRLLGRDVVGTPRVIAVIGIGAYLDPAGPGLPAFFRERGRALFLGCRIGGRPIWFTGRIVEHRRQRLQAAGRRRVVHRWILEDTRRSPVDLGDLAGLALDRHYLIDLDSIRDWAGRLQARGRRFRGKGLLAQALPPGRDREGLAAPGDLALKCELIGLAREGPPPAQRLYEIVREHEVGHLVDALRLLPPQDNPVGVMKLLLRCGLSAQAIQAELERRAQLYALARSAWPHLALANTAGLLPRGAGGRGGPHARGYARLLAQLAEKAPLEGATKNRVAALYRLSPGEITRAARELAEAWDLDFAQLQE